MTKILAAAQVRYDDRTDVIEPIEKLNRENLSVLNRMPFMILEPVMGWNPYTHLVSLDGLYYLARIAKGA